MPIIYHCSNCKIRFKIGWYHFHHYNDGYGSGQFLICANCITNYHIEFALRHKYIKGDARDNYYCHVEYQAMGDNPMAVMKLIREITGLDLVSTKKLAYSAPTLLEKNLEYWEAVRLCDRLKEVGAQARVIVSDELRDEIVVPPKRSDRWFVCIDNFSEQWQWLPCAISGPLSGREEAFDLAEQQCTKCHTKGQFIIDEGHQFNQQCPNCKDNTLEIETAYVT